MSPTLATRFGHIPISMRVNKPENDDPSIVDPVELGGDAAQSQRKPRGGVRH
jgi:hypothetical protein